MRKTAIVLVAVAACAAASPASAHHSHGAFFDACTPVTVEGSVQAVQWKAPHVLIDVKTDQGLLYRAEWTSPQGLSRRGIEPAMVMAGERIVVTGAPLRPVDQLPAERRAAYSDPNLRILDVLKIRDAGDAWSWGVDVMPNSQNCSRGFPFAPGQVR